MSFDLASRLASRRADDLYRQRPLLESAQGPDVVVDGQPLLAFCSNDYLGLANHPEVIAALRAGAERWGVGGGASHLVVGHSGPHHELELALAEFTGRPRALLFSTGYMANLGAVTALVGKGDTVLEDRLNHASLLDAGLLSGARFSRYLHNDPASLAARLDKAEGNTLVVTDGVFSMDGNLADLPALAAVAQARGAWLMVDDAHGFGPLGASGGGIVEHFGLGQEQVPVLIGTLGKGFGTAGAFVAGSEELIETLIQYARPYIYTTSQPPAVACATLKSLELLRRESWRRQHLAALIARFRHGAEALGLTLMDSFTPIQPILVGGSRQAVALAGMLRARGIMVGAIRRQPCRPTARGCASRCPPRTAKRRSTACSKPWAKAGISCRLAFWQRSKPRRETMRDHLILLPGWGLGSAPLEPLRDALHEREPHLNVLIEPLPSLDDAADWLDELDDNLPRDSWLAGWSLGGMLAGELAARRGDDCRGLLTLASNPCFRVREDWPNAMPAETFEDFFEAFLLEPHLTRKRFTLLVSQGARDPRTLARQLQVALPQLEREALVAGLQLLGQLDTRAALENFRGPQLHLFAEADALVPVAAAEALLEWLPDVEVSTLAASHGLPLECPDEVAGAILRFLREGDDA
ncbi:8-amino-7-oxononanoate synthase [Pseudomonas aeruginosa]|nr:8-amino-7-oxononanoate synthase [Pseudomonas aeruginosa]